MTERTSRNLIKAMGAALALFVVSVVAAPAAFAAPTLQISATDGLSDGDTITISATGYQANLAQIAIGQCVEGYTGPSDCNLQGGATFKTADASGSIAAFTIVVKEKFGSHDCTQVQCVIAGAPLPTASDAATVNANTYVAKISFGAVEEPVADPEPAAPTAVTSPDTAAEPTPAADLPRTGAVGNAPMIAWTALGLVVLAGGLGVATRRQAGH